MGRLNPDRRATFDRFNILLAATLAGAAISFAASYAMYWRRPAPVTPAESALVSNAPSQPALAPDPKEENWEQMTEELDRLAERYKGHVAIYLKDLKTGKTWFYHQDDLFAAASLIKVPVMACVFAKIRDGGMSLNDVLTLKRHNRMGGSGSIKWQPDGTKLAVRELLQHMISESDNTATNMLIEAAGLGYIQHQLPQLGLVYTGIYEEGMSLKSGRVARENYTTAREVTMLMDKIYNGKLVDRASSRMMLEILKHKKAVASRLAKGLPSGWEIAHKTGLLRKACHDSAVFLTPNGDYALTVLTSGNPSYKAAKNFITRLGKVTFLHYGGYPRYYTKNSARRHLALR